MSNIKVYIGKAVTLRQIDAVTERGADEVLQLCQKPVVSQADKARVEYLVLQAKDKLLSKDSGGKAAFSAIATFVGLRCALYLAYRRAGVGTCWCVARHRRRSGEIQRPEAIAVKGGVKRLTSEGVVLPAVGAAKRPKTSAAASQHSQPAPPLQQQQQQQQSGSICCSEEDAAAGNQPVALVERSVYSEYSSCILSSGSEEEDEVEGKREPEQEGEGEEDHVKQSDCFT
jgi:hypothetical protein